MGQYIKDGILYLNQYLDENLHQGSQTLLYRTSETSDTFRGTSESFGGAYIIVDYETTEDYVVDRTPTMSAEEIDTMLADLKEDLDYDEFVKLSEESLQAEAEFQALLQETTNPKVLEILKSFELERQQLYDNYYSLADTRMGIDVDDIKAAEDTDELLETLGYTTRQLRSGELADYENNEDFVKMIVEEEDGSTYVNYVKTSTEEMVVVDEKANTVTTFHSSGVNYGNSGARMFRSSRSGSNSGDEYADAINSVSTAFNALEAAVDAEMELTKDRIAKLDDTIGSMEEFTEYERRVVNRANYQRLSFLRHLKTRYIPYIGGLLNIGSLWSDYNDRQVALQNREDTIKEYDDIVAGRDDRDLKDPKACLKALLALADAYQNLADAIGAKIISSVTQLLAGIGSIAALIPTGGWSALFGLATWLAGLAVDKALDYVINEYKIDVSNAKAARDKACETKSRPRRKVEPIIDPSGYVYEAVPSNRVESVTATTYYKGSSGEPVLWDAENYGQRNPLLTTSDGEYRWDVPSGDWKVTYTKDGYEAQDSVDIYGWLPVLPVQTEVHVPLESTAAPAVASAYGYSDSLRLTFSQYMKEESLSGQITMTQGEEVLSGDDLILTWLNSEDSDLYYHRSFASILQITRADGTEWKSGPATITVNGGKNYVDTALDPWSQTIDILTAPAEIQGSAS
ncbi:MAG: hypothetical protein II983_06095, partial [Firmicutes bacterium]|nr:hypothetical protein [Bacillota bacterium]